MRLLIRCAARLYPGAWRARYGAELDALLEDTHAGWSEFADICKGAIKMQILSGSAWRFATVCGLAGLVVAGVIALRLPSQYQSMAVMRMAPGDIGESVENLNRAEQDILSRRSLAAVIQKYDLYPEERKRVPLEDIVEGMRNQYIQIRMARIPGSNAPASGFSIAFDYDDPARAQAVTTDLTDRFTAAMKDSAPLELLDPASRPRQAFAPNRPVILIVGLFLGIVAGFVLLGIRRWPLVPLTGLAVAIIVLPATYLIADQYRSQAVLRSKTADPGQIAKEVVNNRAYLESLIGALGLYPKEANALDRMQRSLVARDIGIDNAKACTVTFDYSDRYKAQAVMKEIVARIGATGAAKIEVLDPASLPAQAFRPNRLAITTTALFAGLLAGAITLAVRRHRAPVPAS
jgi:hypothetical protein